MQEQHRIVIVGGGAGGLELATRLGDHLGKRREANVTLVDRSATHLWKPLLHEVAAGSLDANANQLEYIAQARWHHFEFQQGELTGLDRERKTIAVSAVHNIEGVEVLPPRELGYDTLVLAIGSGTNFFGVPGAAQYSIAVDSVRDAEHFRQRLIAACMRAENRLGRAQDKERPQVRIVIIGGGATGVELSAELRNATQVLGAYGVHHLDPQQDIRITIVESGPRILGPLPERVAQETARQLRALDIDILSNERVTEVEQHAVKTKSGKTLPADVIMWAGGILVSPILSDVGLPVNRLGQVIVKPTLQTEVDDNIFAMGDCAACPWPEQKTTVPPRAQAAHQEARHMYRALCLRLQGKPLPEFTYHDRGSLISLSRYDVIGNLMGKVVGRSLLIEGKLARLLYVSLYRSHLMALHGFMRMALDTLAQWLRRQTAPRIKLH
jgi:NADH dehydrogenase